MWTWHLQSLLNTQVSRLLELFKHSYVGLSARLVACFISRIPFYVGIMALIDKGSLLRHIVTLDRISLSTCYQGYKVPTGQWLERRTPLIPHLPRSRHVLRRLHYSCNSHHLILITCISVGNRVPKSLMLQVLRGSIAVSRIKDDAFS
jgi:hypothetical protein